MPDPKQRKIKGISPNRLLELIDGSVMSTSVDKGAAALRDTIETHFPMFFDTSWKPLPNYFWRRYEYSGHTEIGGGDRYTCWGNNEIGRAHV